MENALKNDWPKKLLAWFDGNKRDLPWRENKDPYRIWVSEVMLQQTRVEAVKPYFENWINQFPTVEALAQATEDEVLRAWQGLGYYSRAKNLQLGVREVVEKYNGKVPETRKEIESLKGVGSYTAGAVLSIAYNKREAAVDGNVLRVYSRLYNSHEDVLKSSAKKKITSLVENTIPKDRPGDFNEALMDFGATLCIPKNPRCAACPLRDDCEAYKEGTVSVLPVRVKKKNVPHIYLAVALIESEGDYLVHRRKDKGLLASMWEFPSVEGGHVEKKALEELVSEFGTKLRWDDDKIPPLTHVFSHRRWEMYPFKGHVKKNPHLPSDWRWIKREEFSLLPWAGPHGKLTVYCR